MKNTDNKRPLNYTVLLIFAPILILIGILGFVIPPDKAFTSGATAYNMLHLIFGAIGLLIVYSKNESYARIFNIGFGIIDLLQAAASLANMFPKEYFQWTRVDDVLHIVIGLFLVAIGLYGYRKSAS